MLGALLLLAPLCAAPPPETDLEPCESRTKQALKQGRENLGEKNIHLGHFEVHQPCKTTNQEDQLIRDIYVH